MLLDDRAIPARTTQRRAILRDGQLHSTNRIHLLTFSRSRTSAFPGLGKNPPRAERNNRRLRWLPDPFFCQGIDILVRLSEVDARGFVE
jgi:hypothetical protein